MKNQAKQQAGIRDKEAKVVRGEAGVIWMCTWCGAYNLTTLDAWTHQCINCGYEIYANAGFRAAVEKEIMTK